MANTTKQQAPSTKPQPPANPDPVAAAEQAIAALDRDRSALVAASVSDDVEMSKHAYAPRVFFMRWPRPRLCVKLVSVHASTISGCARSTPHW
jgi:hypothetical protein